MGWTITFWTFCPPLLNDMVMVVVVKEWVGWSLRE